MTLSLSILCAVLVAGSWLCLYLSVRGRRRIRALETSVRTLADGYPGMSELLSRDLSSDRNYCEIDCVSNGVSFAVTIQRKDRKTPHELRRQAEAERDEANSLLAEAHALLHDTAARGKDGRWLPWSERRAAWVKKCEVRG